MLNTRFGCSVMVFFADFVFSKREMIFFFVADIFSPNDLRRFDDLAEVMDVIDWLDTSSGLISDSSDAIDETLDCRSSPQVAIDRRLAVLNRFRHRGRFGVD